MKRKFRLKAISVFMAMLFVIQVIPMSVVAQGSTDLSNESVPAANGFDNHSQKTDGDGAIVSEVTELREEYVKHFKCDDGTYMAVVYGEPVHYKENSKWKEIDNSLTLSSPADGEAEYSTMSSGTPVSIPQELSGGQKIEITKDDYTVGFGVSTGNKGVNLSQKAEITNVEKDEIAASSETESKSVEAVNAEKTAVRNNSSAVTYSGIFPGADLEYIVSPSKVKENIIVNNRGLEYVYKFDLNFDGLVPVTCEDGSIELVEDGESEPVFVIQAPYMYDANGEYCYDVTMTLSGNTLTVKADSDWINDAERALPVVIDPTYYWYSNTSGGLADSEVDSNHPNNNYSSADTLNVGKNLSSRSRAYFKLTLPTLGENKYIVLATLNLYQNSYTNFFNGSDTYLNIYNLYGYSSWSPSTITWNNQPVSTSVNSYTSNTPVSSTVFVKAYGEQYAFSLLGDMVSSWYEDGTHNNGFMLAFSDESQLRRSIIRSTDYSTQSLRPTLLIAYRDLYCACGEDCVYGEKCPCNCSTFETCNCSCCGVYCGCGKLNCKYGVGCECTCASESVCNCVACKAYTDTTEDVNGNLTSNIISDGNKTMTQTYTYQTGGTKPSSSVDENGNTGSYGYDETTGFLESVTTGGVTVNYSYNADELLSEVSQEVSGLSNDNEIINNYIYDSNEKLSSISHNDFYYNYIYDTNGNNTAINVLGYDNNNPVTQSLAEYTYNTSGFLDTTTYGNDHQISYDYDTDGNVTEISHLFGGVMYPVYTYTYDSEGNLDTASDAFRGTITYFDGNGGYEICDAGSSAVLYSVEYDENGNKTAEICGENFSTIYNNEEFSFQTGCTTNSSSVEYFDSSLECESIDDYFGRRISSNITSYDEYSNEILTCETEIGYNDTATTTGTEVSTCGSIFSIGSTDVNSLSFGFEYDSRGNITAINNTTALPQALYARYEYDEANQLTREDNSIQNKSVEYIYDKGGNIVSKSIYAYTTSEQLGTATDVISYTYDTVWKDKLTSYDGTTITYDEIGNPLEYGDKQYAWMGRELVGYGDENEDEYYYFQYDADGLRTLKREAYETYENDYFYTWSDDGTLLGYSVENEDPSEMDVDVWIIYDENNEAAGFTATQKNVENPEHFVFYYVKNAQGDVIRVVDENGETMVDYNYDAWGNFTITPGQNIWNAVVIYMFNPVTYRGYYYDPDLGLYYLQSRYYNPEWGRFLNADEFEATTMSTPELNKFMYCRNNPLTYVDTSGKASYLKELLSMRFVYSYFFMILYGGTLSSFEVNLDNERLEDVILGTKGIISIDLTENKLAKQINNLNKAFGDFSYAVLTNQALQLFKSNYAKKYNNQYNAHISKREFLFSYDCLKNEIKLHVEAYLWSQGYSGYKATAIFNIWAIKMGLEYNDESRSIFYALTEESRKAYIGEACKSVDIYEADVLYNETEADYFEYYNGINNTYKSTNSDPYYYNGSRSSTVREGWVSELI